MNNNVVDISEADFNEKVIDASNNKLILVDFWAPWCGPCKQLSPTLEKVVAACNDKVVLVKINIDENQQIASQLRIQSIPMVYAFKNKQIVNAFQGVIPEKDIISFVEKALGEKIEKDYSEFYNLIIKHIQNKEFDNAKDLLIEFISENSKEVRAISLLLECYIELGDTKQTDEFLNSLEDEIKKEKDVQKILKRLEIIKKNDAGPSIENLIKKLEKSPNDIDLTIKISEKYFSNNDYDNAFQILLEKYPQNKEIVKNKMIVFFEALGSTHESTLVYRKKLSSIMFA